MPDVVTFDAATLRIIEVDAGGDNSLDVVEIYSEWKAWSLIGDNAKHPPAFRYVGGDPISDVRALGSTFFLTNGWRIRPAERTHNLELVGNLYTDPAGDRVWVNTLGSYTVGIQLTVSNLLDLLQTGISGLTPEEAAALAVIETATVKTRKLTTNKAVITENPDGTRTVTLYDDDGLTPIHVHTVTADELQRIPA